MKGFLVGLAVAVAAIASGSASAAAPAQSLSVRARLTPVAGTQATGRFSGMLTKTRVRQIAPGGGVAGPSRTRWQLTWSLRLPKLDGQATASLRIGSARATRALCTGCSTRETGTMTLSARQGGRIAKGDAIVVVRTRSAKLRGKVKVSPTG
jgi:opacity protein-like surface antigen